MIYIQAGTGVDRPFCRRIVFSGCLGWAIDTEKGKGKHTPLQQVAGASASTVELQRTKKKSDCIYRCWVHTIAHHAARNTYKYGHVAGLSYRKRLSAVRIMNRRIAFVRLPDLKDGLHLSFPPQW